MPHVFSPAAYRCFLVEMRCTRGSQPVACASHSLAGACLRCLGFEMYEIGKGKGSGRAKFGVCCGRLGSSWPVLAQDFAANSHRDHRSSPEGWALMATKRTRISSPGSWWRQAADLCSLGTSLPPDWPPMAALEGICTLQHPPHPQQESVRLIAIHGPARSRRCSHDTFFSYINAPSEVP